MDVNVLNNEEEVSEFESNFLNYVLTIAPLYCLPSLNKLPDDEYNDCKEFFSEMERFVLGSSILNKKESNSNLLCGAMFKVGDSIYTCRDCAANDSCVFCSTCFFKSHHVNHNYQEFSSSGGFCDCGDLESWKKFPRCSIHGGNDETVTNMLTDDYDCIEDVEGAVALIPVDVKLRFLILTRQIFEKYKYFIMRPSCKDNEELRRTELERELEFVKTKCPDVDVEEYALVVYNNEIHNLELLQNILSLFLDDGTQCIENVKRVGRFAATSGNDLDEITNTQQNILTVSKEESNVELLCRIHHPLFLAIQVFMNHYLRWLQEFTKEYPTLRMLLFQYMFQDVKIDEDRVFTRSTFILDVFESHTNIWKVARKVTSSFIVATFMHESYFRRLFAVEFVNSYATIIELYSVDDQEVEGSLFSFGFQIFIKPSLAMYLFENNNVLKIILKSVHDKLLKHSQKFILDDSEVADILRFDKNDTERFDNSDSLKRYLQGVNDITYLLRNLVKFYVVAEVESENNLQQWSDRSIENFMDYVAILADILSLLQDAYVIERKNDTLIELKMNWEKYLLMNVNFVPCLIYTSQLITSNTTCCDRTFDMFRKIIKKRLIDLESKKRVIFEYGEYKATVIENNLPNKFASVIKPLHRFMTCFLHSPRFINLLTEPEIDCLFDQALQVVVFVSQNAGGMWTNYEEVNTKLIASMRSPSASGEMMDRDIQLIQQLAKFMRPEEFIVKCIHKFDLKNFLLCSNEVLSEKKSLIQRTEDFLHLLIMTLFYRNRPGVGKDVTQESCYKNIILHVLCRKSTPSNNIFHELRTTFKNISEEKLLELLKEVSDQTIESKVLIHKPKITLIKSKFDRFAPCFFIKDRNETKLYVENLLKEKGILGPLIPPEPIQLSEDFAKLYEYISDGCFLKLLDQILSICCQTKHVECWSETMLDMVLYLIGASLMEDVKTMKISKDERRRLFIQNAMRSSLGINILSNLELLGHRTTSSTQRELIKWTIKKWNEVLKVILYERYSDRMKVVDIDPKSMEITMEVESENTIHKTKEAKAQMVHQRRQLLFERVEKAMASSEKS